VLDYARSFGLRAAVFRMSCIYGPHQQGNEDQGWVAHFLKQVMAGRPVTLFGDGRQVRDVLCVDDLADAMLRVTEDMAGDAPGGTSVCSGKAFNIGGGPSNTTSLHEMLTLISEVSGRKPEVRYCPWRIGDQRWFVSDNRHIGTTCGWEPKVTIREGVEQLHEWLVHDGRPVGQAAS
jgi:CDP-paratose 2-epimerase